MYNGIAIGGGNLTVEYVAHPGTPLQYLIAISARIVHFFQPGKPYPQDFIDHPEKYIHAANLLMNLVIALVMFMGALKCHQYSGTYLAGFMLQLSPFANAAILGLAGRLIPESIMVIPLLLICIMVIKNIYHPQKPDENTGDIVRYAIIMGFGIACKLSFIPVVIIPLVVLKTSIKQKLQYLLYVLLFVALFAYPVVFEFSTFREWVVNMFTHTGMHGGGSKGIIDFSSVAGHFSYLYRFDQTFFYLMGTSLLLAVAGTFPSIRKKYQTNAILTKAMVAINTALLLSIALTLKHFALHYFIPFYIFKFMLIFFMALFIVQLTKNKSSKLLKLVVTVLTTVVTLYIAYSQVPAIRAHVEKQSERKEQQRERYNNTVPLVEKNNPIILTGPYYGAPFVQFAHYNGFMMSYRMKGYFKPMLQSKYPKSYLYVPWSDKFNYWNEFVGFEHILNQTQESFYVYIGRDRKKDLNEIEARLWNTLPNEMITKNMLFEDQETGEMLIEYRIRKKSEISD
jgi:hypothetical protein